jgi:hypothetical protein
LGESRSDSFEIGDVPDRECFGIRGEPSQRQQAPLGVKFHPAIAGIIGKAPASGGSPVFPPKRRQTRHVELREGPAQICLGSGIRAPFFDPFECEKRWVVRNIDDFGDEQGSRLAQQQQRSCLRRECQWRWSGVRFRENAATATEFQAVGDGHVSTGKPCRADQRGSEPRRDFSRFQPTDRFEQ